MTPTPFNKSSVIKASAAIHVPNRITLLQRRAYNVLLANAYDELPTDEKRHQIRLRDLEDTLEFGSTNRTYLKEALEALVTCKVKWDMFNKDGRKELWGVTTMLAEAIIDDGILTYAYAPTLREGLYNPKVYAKLNLKMQNNFRGKHAQALWELCVDALDLSKNYGETPWIPIEEVKEFLGLLPGEYTEFKIFNRAVIKPTVKEINEATDYIVEVKTLKKGRKITALKFIVILPKVVNSREKQQILFPDIDDMEGVALELHRAGIARGDALKIYNAGWEYVDEDKRPSNVTDTDFDAYIMEKIHLARNTPGIDNPGGWLKLAIKENFRNVKFEQEMERKAKQEIREKIRVCEGMIEKMQQECDKEMGAIHNQIANDNPEEIEELVETVLEEESHYRALYRPDKSLLHNYHDRVALNIAVNNRLMERYPEKYQKIGQKYESRISEGKHEIENLKRQLEDKKEAA